MAIAQISAQQHGKMLFNLMQGTELGGFGGLARETEKRQALLILVGKPLGTLSVEVGRYTRSGDKTGIGIIGRCAAISGLAERLGLNLGLRLNLGLNLCLRLTLGVNTDGFSSDNAGR